MESARERPQPGPASLKPSARTHGTQPALPLGNSAPQPRQEAAAGKGDNLTRHTPCGGPIKLLCAEKAGSPSPTSLIRLGSALKSPGPHKPRE